MIRSFFVVLSSNVALSRTLPSTQNTKEEPKMKHSKINSCAVWAKKLATSHLEDFSPSEQAALLAHLEKCPACAAIRLEYQLMDARIHSYPAKERLLHQPPLSFKPEYEFP